MSAVKDAVETRRPRRRDFLGLAIVATAFAGAAAAQTPGGTCEVGDTPARASMRKALEYASPSKTPGKTCAGCAFFNKTAPTCGSCQLLTGPVSATAVCGSWAPKK